jgi:hypothetical protein
MTQLRKLSDVSRNAPLPPAVGQEVDIDATLLERHHRDVFV